MSSKVRRKARKFEELKTQVIELADRGYLDNEICLRLNIYRSTLHSWFKKFPKFKDVIDRIRSEHAKFSIESNLFRLANGAETIETTEEFYETRMIQGEERKVKKTIKKKRAAPNIDSLKSLAAKYCPDEFKEVEKTEHEYNVRITSQHQALSDEEKLKLIQDDSKIIETTTTDKEDN